MSAAPEVEARTEKYYEELESHHLAPLWQLHTAIMPPEPRPKCLAWQWRGEDLRRLAAEAGELVPIDRGGDRRVLTMANPGLDGAPWAAPTLWGAIQQLGPHEGAPAHRHSPAAIRYVLEGSGVWTTVNGDAIAMEPGDLILTPPGLWHDHFNPTDESMTWFDGLDLPLIGYLDATFVDKQPPEDHQEAEGQNLSEAEWASGAIVDMAATTEGPSSPRLRYPWAETDAALASALGRSGGSIASVAYRNPATGGPVLPTLECRMQRILAGASTPTVRKVGYSLIVVLHGTGESIIGGTRFRWAPGDVIVSPSWAPVEHTATTDADLFEISDEPVLKALHLFREEALDERQTVNADFELGESTL